MSPGHVRLPGLAFVHCLQGSAWEGGSKQSVGRKGEREGAREKGGWGQEEAI